MPISTLICNVLFHCSQLLFSTKKTQEDLETYQDKQYYQRVQLLLVSHLYFLSVYAANPEKYKGYFSQLSNFRN